MGAATLATNLFRLVIMSGLQNEGHIGAAAGFLSVACLNAVCIAKTPCSNDFVFCGNCRELISFAHLPMMSCEPAICVSRNYN